MRKQYKKKRLKKIIKIINQKINEEKKEFGTQKGHTLSFWLSYINYYLTSQDKLKSKNHLNGIFKIIKLNGVDIYKKIVPLNCDKYTRNQTVYIFEDKNGN